MASVLLSLTQPEIVSSHSARLFDTPGAGFASLSHSTSTWFSVRQGDGLGGPPQPGGAEGAVLAVAKTPSRTRSYWLLSSSPFASGQEPNVCPCATVQ